MKLRPALLLVHRWVGIVSAVFIIILAVTGCVLIFENSIDRALHSDTAYVTPGAKPLPTDVIVARVAAAFPGTNVTRVGFADNPSFAWSTSLSNKLTAFVDPYTGRVLGARNTQQGFTYSVHMLHTRYLAGATGELFVGWLTVITLLISISGLYLWWPRKIVAVGRYSSWRRTNFDLHNALGLWASALMIVISLTGLIIAFEKTTDAWILKLGAATPSKPATLKSTPTAGVARIPIDEAVAIAKATLPGVFVSGVNVPAKPGDIYAAFAKFPEDRTPAGRSHVFIDQFSGKVLAVDNTRTAPIGTRILNMKRALHTGDIYGATSQTLYFLGSLALAGQVVTGVLVWWKPKRKPASAAARSTAPSTARTA